MCATLSVSAAAKKRRLTTSPVENMKEKQASSKLLTWFHFFAWATGNWDSTFFTEFHRNSRGPVQRRQRELRRRSATPPRGINWWYRFPSDAFFFFFSLSFFAMLTQEGLAVSNYRRGSHPHFTPFPPPQVSSLWYNRCGAMGIKTVSFLLPR